MPILYKDFANRLVENKTPEKTAVFTFGRFNPPSSGHLVNIDKVFSIPGDHFIYVSHTEDNDKNPLSTSIKLKLLKSARPDQSNSFKVSNHKMYSPVQIAEHLKAEGYDKIIFVIGQDRLEEFKKLLKPQSYVEVVSSGKRDKEISGSKLRELAIKDDFEDFAKIMGNEFPKDQIKKAFNAVRKKLVTEESQLRENYISGNIFNIGSIIIEKNADSQIPDYIEIDGKKRSTKNSEGKLIYPTEEGIINFWRWFGDSKVVDSNGNPLVVYHGTNDDIHIFDGKIGNTGGMFFTDNKELIHSYMWGEDSNAIPVFLKIRKPFKIDAKNSSWEELEINGNKNLSTDDVVRSIKYNSNYDGLILENINDSGNSDKFVKSGNIIGDIYVVYSSDQIKSSIGNNGNFSKSKKITEDIYCQTYYQIIDRGTNYVRVVNESGEIKSFFLNNIIEVNDDSILERFESNKKKNNQLTFKGYSTTNFTKDILEKFNSIIDDENVYAVLSAIKHTDKFFSTNDIVEQYDHFERSEYYLNQLECLSEHVYRDVMENIIAEKIAGNIPSIKEITRNDKVKTADIILAALGIEEKGTPEEKINKAAKEVAKNVSSEMKEIYGSLFQLADDVGIPWNKDIFTTNQQKDLGLIESDNFKYYIDSLAKSINSFDQILELYNHYELVAIDEDYNLFELDNKLLIENAITDILKVNPLLKEKTKSIKVKKPSTKEQIHKKAKCLALKYLKDRKHRNAIHKLTDRERSKLEDILNDKGSIITNISDKLCKKIAKIEKERLQESYLEEVYQEESDSTFDSNGILYNVNKLIELSEDLPVEEFSITKLDWVLDYDKARLDELKSELKRVESSDFNVPILIYKDNTQDKKEQWVVVDGIHRLAKAITKNKKVIKVKKLTDEIMHSSEIKKD